MFICRQASQGSQLKSGTDWAIEFLRGMAALMVVLTHYHELMGWHDPRLRFFSTGVDLFFVISGFVFAPYLFGKKVRVKSFFIRRLFRIYPLYLVAVVLYAVLKPLEPSLFLNIAKHLLFLHTVESREVAFSLNPAFWSLPPEVEFYLAIPVLALLSLRTWRGLLWLIMAALLIHFLISIPDYPFEMAWVLNGLRYHLPGLLIEFLLGGLAWQISRCAFGRGWRWFLFLTGFGVYTLLGMHFARVEELMLAGVINQKPWISVHLGLFASFAFALMVSAVARRDPTSSSINNVIALWMGNLSYGIYLFHNAVPKLIDGMIVPNGTLSFGFISLCLTLVISVFLHVLIEAPMRDYGVRAATRNQFDY